MNLTLVELDNMMNLLFDNYIKGLENMNYLDLNFFIE